jgi:hypothetical protein
MEIAKKEQNTWYAWQSFSFEREEGQTLSQEKEKEGRRVWAVISRKRVNRTTRRTWKGEMKLEEVEGKQVTHIHSDNRLSPSRRGSQ